jgi:UDP-glucose-4-epimerase GalE
MNRTILVTGGAGYIGSHTCKALAETGFIPVTFDNLSLGHRSFVRWGPLIEADIRDVRAVTRAIQKFRPIGAIHFAASAYVGESVSDPAKYYQNNVVGTLGLLEAMRQNAVRNIVFSSSCAVYGAADSDRISEQSPTRPVNPYGASKLMCEMILTDFAHAYGIEPIILRYFNASGADAASSIGEDRVVETRLIPRAILSLLGHVDDFVVFGSDFPTRDGTAVRDYIHVSDLARAHVLALHYLLSGQGGGCFNLGTGRGYSVKEVLTAIADVSGGRFEPPTGARRVGDPAHLVADASLAEHVLGFSPRCSDLRQIVADAWQWHCATHGNRVTH